jgi:hypothetical protein
MTMPYLTTHRQIDYMNAANVKVLQLDTPRNILTELNMNDNEYAWVRSVSKGKSSIEPR